MIAEIYPAKGCFSVGKARFGDKAAMPLRSKVISYRPNGKTLQLKERAGSNLPNILKGNSYQAALCCGCRGIMNLSNVVRT
jgi:hypothetical protein